MQNWSNNSDFCFSFYNRKALSDWYMFLLYRPSPSPEKKDRMNIWYPHHNWLCLPPPHRRFSGFEDSVWTWSSIPPDKLPCMLLTPNSLWYLPDHQKHHQWPRPQNMCSWFLPSHHCVRKSCHTHHLPSLYHTVSAKYIPVFSWHPAHSFCALHFPLDEEWDCNLPDSL